ncbi:MAG TPA: glycosyltransferase [Candidatus Paceibacterota bacterium]|jgi:glycosyltransferase involved in cell wall biosynthesis|nr:glycosyltransferase [Candidatus Paceibacterota bacterium]
MSKLFFSIVVPAHNEEKYIEDTLGHLKRLEYPAGKFEVVVVENGSADRTFELAKRFERNNFHVLQSGKGVSRAKNAGIDRLSPQSDWVIFLDADTILEKDFLNELNVYLSDKKGLAVGTVSLRPIPDRPYARAWLWVHNVGHMLSKTSFAIKIVRRSLFPSLRFDQNLVTAEDIHMIQQALPHGKFFYLWTKNVATSTRRFEKLGWWYVLFYWVFVALLPEKWQQHFTYEAAR